MMMVVIVVAKMDLFNEGVYVYGSLNNMYLINGYNITKALQLNGTSVFV